MKDLKLKNLNSEELKEKCGALKKELFNLKFQLSLGQLQNTAQIKLIRRQIARANTIESFREKGVTTVASDS